MRKAEHLSKLLPLTIIEPISNGLDPADPAEFALLFHVFQILLDLQHCSRPPPVNMEMKLSNDRPPIHAGHSIASYGVLERATIGPQFTPATA
jgi:hypothetical protein